MKLSDAGAIPIRVVGQSILSCQHTTILHELALPETIETTPVYSVAGPLGGGTTCGYASVAGAAPCHFSGEIQTEIIARAWLGEAYLLAGCIDEAMPLAMRALDLARAHKERDHEAWNLRLLGEVYGQQHTPALKPAEAVYRPALALAAELGMAPLQAHSYLGLGMLYARSRRPPPPDC